MSWWRGNVVLRFASIPSFNFIFARERWHNSEVSLNVKLLSNYLKLIGKVVDCGPSSKASCRRWSRSGTLTLQAQMFVTDWTVGDTTSPFSIHFLQNFFLFCITPFLLQAWIQCNLHDKLHPLLLQSLALARKCPQTRVSYEWGRTYNLRMGQWIKTPFFWSLRRNSSIGGQ